MTDQVPLTAVHAPKMVQTEVLCWKDGVLLQLWVDVTSVSNVEGREWRQVPDFEQASVEFKCTKVA